MVIFKINRLLTLLKFIITQNEFVKYALLFNLRLFILLLRWAIIKVIV